MCILQIHAQCYDKFFEVSPDETENAELMVEDMMSRILLVLFGGGTVDDVTIDFSSGLRMGLLHCAIQIRAQCSCQHFALFPCTKEHMQHTVEKSTQSLLRELFGSVKVDSVVLSPSVSDSENDPALSWRR
ncbi:MAG TPA: hypothetical protein VKR06_19095 [Ktedonosporobacter sp.]|nr:hypothetical protein [Ktedonosporobacter sp.]